MAGANKAGRGSPRFSTQKTSGRLLRIESWFPAVPPTVLQSSKSTKPPTPSLPPRPPTHPPPTPTHRPLHLPRAGPPTPCRAQSPQGFVVGERRKVILSPGRRARVRQGGQGAVVMAGRSPFCL